MAKPTKSTSPQATSRRDGLSSRVQVQTCVAPRWSRNSRVNASVRPLSWMSSTSSTGSPFTPAGASPIRLTMPELVVALP